MKTMDLFDAIEEPVLHLQALGMVNTARIEELTLKKIAAKGKHPSRRRRSVGVYILVAALVTLLSATTVFAYVGFTKYENPLHLLNTFYGDQDLESFDGGEVMRDAEEKPYTVVLPAIERVPLDEELAEEVTPPIAAVGQSVSWDDYTLTIVAHQHDKNLGAGIVYYTLENPNGISDYDTQFNGELWWKTGEIMSFRGCSWENFIIPGETTATKLSVACYYHGTERVEQWRQMDHILMRFSNTEETIQLPKNAAEEETTALISENGEILISAIGMEIRLQDMLFLHKTYENGRTYPPTDDSDITYLAVKFADGSEYLIEQEADGTYIQNIADASLYDDPVFGTVASYMFNRVIDPAMITGVMINDTLYPVQLCEDVSVRLQMLPKTEVIDWEALQSQIVEITP